MSDFLFSAGGGSVDEGFDGETENKSDQKGGPEEERRGDALKSMAEIHAEGGPERSKGQKDRDKHIEAVAGGEELLAVLGLFFGLAGDHVFEAVLGIGMQEFNRTFDFHCLVASDEDVAVVGDGFAGLLESGVHVPRRAEERRGDLENLKVGLGIGGLLHAVLEFIHVGREILQVSFQLGETGAVTGGFPVAGRISPEEDRFAVAFAGLGDFMENEKEMAIGDHHALAAGLFAEASVEDFGNFPVGGKDGVHAG